MIRKSHWFRNPSTEHFVTPYFEALFLFQPFCVVAIIIFNRCALSVNSFNLAQGVGFTFMAIVHFECLYSAEEIVGRRKVQKYLMMWNKSGNTILHEWAKKGNFVF